MNRDARKDVNTSPQPSPLRGEGDIGIVDYNSFAKTFSDSRKNMKWEEISYFLWFIDGEKKILDVWCGNGRFLWELKKLWIKENDYLWIDLSKWLLSEAKNNYPWYNFQELNMLDLNKSNSFLLLGGRLGWGAIFFIASFHHLNSIEDRLKVLKDTFNLLESWWIVFMTNWALDSEFNKEKYKDSIISPSPLKGEGARGWGFKNDFWSKDYNIKIWKFTRFYHCFSLDELEYLSREVWFEIIENREFDNQKNYILILKKR